MDAATRRNLEIEARFPQHIRENSPSEESAALLRLVAPIADKVAALAADANRCEFTVDLEAQTMWMRNAMRRCRPSS